MAISVRAVATGTSANTTTGVCGLPTGTAVGDVTFIAYIQTVPTAYFSGTLPTFTPPAGWTVLLNANGILVIWRAFQTGDPTTGITCTSTNTNWFLSLAISYTGLDTTSPVDASTPNFRFAAQNSASTVTPLLCRAPSLNPNFAGSQLLCIYCEGGSSGRTIALPSGLTARANTATGPNLRMADKALTDGTPTGTFDATISGTVGELYFGMSIALKASGAAATTLAAARPEVCGFYNDQTSTAGAYALLLDRLNVQDQDMVVFAMAGADTVATPPSGYTQRSSQQGALLYTNIWSTGDTKAPSWSFTNTGGTPTRTMAVALVRKIGVDTGAINQDALANTTATATSNPTATTTTQTPAGASELLIVLFGSASQTAGTWSAVTAGITDEVIAIAGPGLRFGWVLPAASPTGTFAAKWTVGAGSVTLASAAQLIRIGTGAVTTPKPFFRGPFGAIRSRTLMAALAAAMLGRIIERNPATTRRRLLRLRAESGKASVLRRGWRGRRIS